MIRVSQRIKFHPLPFGPNYELVDKHIIRIVEGPLKNQSFILENHYQPKTLDTFLYATPTSLQKEEIAHCFSEYQKDECITIWDVMVRSDYQRCGLAELLIKFQIRELLTRQKETRFRIRMVQLYEIEGKTTVRLKNVGMGIIAYKLGLSCEYNLEKFLRNHEITDFSVISPTDDNPPAYQIFLKSFPYVLVAFMIDIDKERPLTDYGTYQKIKSADEFLIEMARHRALIIGNADYFLKSDGIVHFINRIANNEEEAQIIYKKILPFE
jgi:GNAT superfamily N-acetyltransferase